MAYHQISPPTPLWNFWKCSSSTDFSPPEPSQRLFLVLPVSAGLLPNPLQKSGEMWGKTPRPIDRTMIPTPLQSLPADHCSHPARCRLHTDRGRARCPCPGHRWRRGAEPAPAPSPAERRSRPATSPSSRQSAQSLTPILPVPADGVAAPRCDPPVVPASPPCFRHASWIVVLQLHYGFQLLPCVALAAGISVDALQLEVVPTTFLGGEALTPAFSGASLVSSSPATLGSSPLLGLHPLPTPRGLRGCGCWQRDISNVLPCLQYAVPQTLACCPRVLSLSPFKSRLKLFR